MGNLKRRANLKSMVTLNVPDSPLPVLFFQIKKSRSLAGANWTPLYPLLGTQQAGNDLRKWLWRKASAQGWCDDLRDQV